MYGFTRVSAHFYRPKQCYKVMLLLCQGFDGLFGFNWFKQREIKVYNKNENDEPQHMNIAVVNLNCASVESVLVCHTAFFSGVTQ